MGVRGSCGSSRRVPAHCFVRAVSNGPNGEVTIGRNRSRLGVQAGELGD
jgi:hypothetical protein